MARKKKAATFQGVRLPPPYPTASALAFQQQALQFANNTLTISPFTQPISFGFDELATLPEPKDEPKTVVGLTGYRLYTLDNDLYLVGAQGNKQKGRESEQAQHTEPDDGFDFAYTNRPTRPPNHPAPAWNCLCGFAAFFWPTSLGQPEWNGVLAEVQADGRYIECEQGWRAERIVLSKLWVACPIFPDAALEILRKRYEVPVEILR